MARRSCVRGTSSRSSRIGSGRSTELLQDARDRAFLALRREAAQVDEVRRLLTYAYRRFLRRLERSETQLLQSLRIGEPFALALLRLTHDTFRFALSPDDNAQIRAHARSPLP